MKPLALLPLLLVVSAINGFGADSNLVGELDELTRNRDQALSTAKKAIDEKYQSSLKALLERATQSGDQATAEKVGQALETLAPTAPKVVTTEEQRAVVGTWKFLNHPDVAKLAVRPTCMHSAKQLRRTGIGTTEQDARSTRRLEARATWEPLSRSADIPVCGLSEHLARSLSQQLPKIRSSATIRRSDAASERDQLCSRR